MSSRQLRRAFTLVELLVVIGIIAVLIAILLPVLGKVKEQGNRIKCASNLRQLGTSTMMYLDDNKQFYPWPAVGVAPEDWIYWHAGRDRNQGRLVKYQGRVFNENLYRCPSDQNWAKRPYPYSYTINYRVSGWKDGGIPAVKLPRIIRPADKILYIDESDLTVDDGAWAPDHYFGDQHNLLSNRHDKTRESIANPKLGRGGVVYCDGHYEYCERWKSLDAYYNDPLYAGPVTSGAY